MATLMSTKPGGTATVQPIAVPIIIRDSPGAPWEKRGNTLWVGCPSCQGWFPVNPALARPEAPPACCPQCHREFKVAAAVPR